MFDGESGDLAVGGRRAESGWIGLSSTIYPDGRSCLQGRIPAPLDRVSYRVLKAEYFSMRWSRGLLPSNDVQGHYVV